KHKRFAFCRVEPRRPRRCHRAALHGSTSSPRSAFCAAPPILGHICLGPVPDSHLSGSVMIATIAGCGRSARSQEGYVMTKSLVGLTFVALLASACGDTWGQRAVTGGAIGAGTGAVVGAATGMGPLTGAVVGGAVGAGVGAATTPKRGYPYD